MPLFNPPASAGGSALDANGNLVLPAPTAATVPAANTIAERTITRAGFSQLGYANVDIPDLTMMPNLENYGHAKVESNGTGGVITLGCTSSGAGGVITVTPAFTTYSNSRPLTQLQTSTTAGGGAGMTAVHAPRTRGNAARRGGFYAVIKFMPVLLAGHQGAIGLTNGAGVFAGEPSADTASLIGMICDSADVNWQIFAKPSSAAGTKIVDTGIAKTTTGAILSLTLYAPPNSTGVQYLLENEETQAVVVSGTITLTLPTAITTMNSTSVKCRNGVTTTAAAINLLSIYNGSRY